MRFKKRRKSGRRFGNQTAFRGAKERTRGSGNRGGKGMSGTGKRGDQRKSWVINLTGGNNYFGKSRTLRRGRKPKKLNSINLDSISSHYAGKKEVDLTGYKILADGELTIKVNIKASAASAVAIEKIKSLGSTLELKKQKKSSKVDAKQTVVKKK
ncbi:MAG: uL15m family ribosomal protein [Nanoarchaeota archaeon]